MCQRFKIVGSLTMVPAGNSVKLLPSVKHTTKAIHHPHHHHHHHQVFSFHFFICLIFQSYSGWSFWGWSRMGGWWHLSHISHKDETWHNYTWPKEDPRKTWITWHTSSVLLTSALMHRKSANFAISENAGIDCISVHNF